VSEEELPPEWREVLNPDSDLKELGVFPVLRIEHPVFWGFVGFPLLGVLFSGGVAMLVLQIRRWEGMGVVEFGAGLLMALSLMSGLLLFFPYWLRMRRNMRVKRAGQYRLGVFFTDEAVLIRPHPGEVSLIPRDLAVAVHTEEFRSENAGARLIETGVVFLDRSAGGRSRVNVSFLNDDGQGRFNHRVFDWVERREYRWENLTDRTRQETK